MNRVVLLSRSTLKLKNLIWVYHVNIKRFENVHDAQKCNLLILGDFSLGINQLFESTLLHDMRIEANIEDFDEHFLRHILDHEIVLLRFFLCKDFKDQAGNMVQYYLLCCQSSFV